MKTLQAFWHWVDNEKPDTTLCIQKAYKAGLLSEAARQSLEWASDIVLTVHIPGPVGYSLRGALDRDRRALKAISLLLCEPVQEMLARREEAMRVALSASRRIITEPSRVDSQVKCTCGLTFDTCHVRCPRCNRLALSVDKP